MAQQVGNLFDFLGPSHRYRQEQLLISALTPFNSGQRENAIPYLVEVLNDRVPIPEFRLSAACLLGETYRGMGKFELAGQHYELALAAANNIPLSNAYSEPWYQIYYPRTLLALIMIYRRLLFDDHEKIRSLIDKAREDFVHFPSTDLNGQLIMIEGLYFRQLENLDDSINRIISGLEQILPIHPPYSFLHPEQIEALLMLTYLCDDANNFLALRLARKVLKEDKNRWSNGVACAVLLHIYLKRILDNRLQNFSKTEFSKDDYQDVKGWMSLMMKCAEFEIDPLLKSEGILLEIIWRLMEEEFKHLPTLLLQLQKTIQGVPAPIRLLRSVEVGSLKFELKLAGYFELEAVQYILTDGLQAFSEISNRLKAYNCSEESIYFWASCLHSNCPESSYILEHYYSEPVFKLRCRLWP